MKKILENLIQYKSLSREEAREVLVKISEGAYNESQIAAFITVYLMRSITVEELSGFRDALLELCVPFDTEGWSTIDVCGTGGDGKNTFNISTLSAFVLAGAGYKVTKHGNYGVSSVSGSSNVLEHFGYQFTNDKSLLMKQLETNNICFLHAPLFHPALKSVGPIRKQLGIKTFFNMLGPLVNPAHPKQQMVGVFSLELARLYQYIIRLCMV
jgi:anthranilate phosphoribosyltransferase